MKFTFIAISTAAIAAAALNIAPAAACTHGCRDGGSHHKHHANKIRYSGKHGVGYYRRGPISGYGFGFSSYKGDPFGADDYSDGELCHYLRGRDFCYSGKVFDGFRRG